MPKATKRKSNAVRRTARKDRLVVDMSKVMPNHLEFEVQEEDDGTFTVIEHTAGPLVPDVYFTGFPTRHLAEVFVVAYPDPGDWE